MTKKPKSLGQIAYESDGKIRQAFYHWRDTPFVNKAIWETVAQAVKRAVLREVKPQLDAGKVMRNTLEGMANAGGRISAKRCQKLADLTLLNADELLKRKAGK